MSVSRVLAVLIVLLVGAHFFALGLKSGLDVDTGGVLTSLDLAQERSIGTWVNAVLLAVAALAAAAAGRAAAPDDRRLRTGWYALAGLLALASIDEVGGIHESLIDVIRSAVDLPGFLFYAAWVIPALAIVAAFAVWQIGFYRRLPRWLARRVALGLGVYVVGAAGFELVEGSVLAEEGGTFTPAMQVLVGIEEGIEMAAAAFILLAILRHLTITAPTWSVLLQGSGRVSVDVAASGPLPQPATPRTRRFAREQEAADREPARV